jgi:hypothetical protein
MLVALEALLLVTKLRTFVLSVYYKNRSLLLGEKTRKFPVTAVVEFV